MNRLHWVIAGLLLLFIISFRVSVAQGPVSTPGVALATPSPNSEDRLRNLEGKVNILEQKQDVLMAGFEARLGDLRNTFLLLGTALGLVVAGLTIWQTIRQGQQQNQQLEYAKSYQGQQFELARTYQGQQFELAKTYQGLQQNLSDASAKNTGYASALLQTITALLDNRLMQTTTQEEEIKRLMDEYGKLSQFIDQQKRAIEHRRGLLESTAKDLCQIQRHNLEKHVVALEAFARDFDGFKGANPSEEEFNGQCLYIRGVAAHFQNDFRLTQEYLKKTKSLPKDKDPEPAFYEKRLAIANFYLGLNYLDLGELAEAEEFLQEAFRLDPNNKDFLTRVIIAEVYVMSGEFEKADDFLKMVEDGLNTRKRAAGELLHHELMMLSRVHLMRVDIDLLGKEGIWLERARRHAEAACAISPDYYYASFTLAQVLREISRRDEIEDAEKKDLLEVTRKMFAKSYSQILDTGDLYTITLVRSRIYLLMVAAICRKQADVVDDTAVSRYLDNATSLLQDLPRIDSRIATVLSPITRRNEKSEVISSQIKEIKHDTWSL